jgi:hypothetical protein
MDLLDLSLWPGGDSARGLDVDGLGAGAVTLPRQGRHLYQEQILPHRDK